MALVVSIFANQRGCSGEKYLHTYERTLWEEGFRGYQACGYGPEDEYMNAWMGRGGVVVPIDDSPSSPHIKSTPFRDISD